MLPGKPGKDKKPNYKLIKKQNKMSGITLSPKKFDDYITSTDDNLQIITPPTTAARFGWTPTNVTDWHDYRTQWEEDLYIVYKVKTKRSTTLREQVKDFIANFRLFGNPLLDKAAASTGATLDDAGLSGITPHRQCPKAEVK